MGRGREADQKRKLAANMAASLAKTRALEYLEPAAFSPLTSEAQACT